MCPLNLKKERESSDKMAGLKYNCDTSVFLDSWNGVILPSCDVWGKKQHAKLRNM